MVNIKSIRECKGLSQQELARRSGVTQAAISAIESGDTETPRIDTVQKLALGLDCTIIELLGKRPPDEIAAS